MSPTSYLAAPPRGGSPMVATGRAAGTAGVCASASGCLALECRADGRGLTQGRGDRHRHQLDAAAGRRRRRGPGVAGRAAQPGDPARPRRRPLRAALGRGDRGRLRGDRRLRRRSTRSRAPSTVDAIATSAVRDAANGGAFVAELRERFALSARVLDGEEEARLTYLGATLERPPTDADPGRSTSAAARPS